LSFPECPFVGLEPFSRQNARYFFGRELDSKILANNVLTRPITVLYGASGVGKSSVLEAGLPAALETQFGAVTLGLRRSWHNPGDCLSWLRDRIEAARAAPELPFILVFDQFEEYFLYRSKDRGDQFEQALAGLLADRTLRTNLLFSLREDGLHLLDQLRLWLPGILDNTIELDHLEESEVREAIEGPIAVFNKENPELEVRLGKDFVDDLLADLRGAMQELAKPRVGSGSDAIELPFLQLALQRLWLRMLERETRCLDTDLLRDLGGVSGIVRAHLRDRFDAFSDGERLIASRVFHYLVTPSGGKIAYSAADLAKLSAETGDRAIDPALISAFLAKLAGGHARVLRQVGEQFELFHDVLAKPILDWRANVIQKLPFAYVTEAFTGDRISLPGFGCLLQRLDRSYLPHSPLALPMVSRNHALIMRDGTILDLRSRFGTTVNARPLHLGEIREEPLKTGDVIGIANIAALVFETVLDTDLSAITSPYSPAQGTEGAAWGVIIDGTARRITKLFASDLYLSLSADGEIVIGEQPAARAFAAVKHAERLDERRKWHDVSIQALTDAPKLTEIDRDDAYHTLDRELPVGEAFPVRLAEIPHPNPQTMSDLEGACRGVFRFDGHYFEIIIDETIRLSG
jgi:hypothetical protein